MSRSRVALPLLGLIALAGFGFWIYQLQEGLIVTNMRNSFSWGLYIAMWAFFVGTAAGGLVVTSGIYLFKAEGLKPVGKIASLTAAICALAAMAMLAPDLGRIDRIYQLLLHPNFNSVLPWDFIVLATYAILAAVYTYVQMRPDVARGGLRIPLIGTVGKRRGLGEDELERMQQKSDRVARYMAPVALVLAILIHTVTAWVLATQLGRSWWFGGTLAPAFIASAIASGPAVVILASLYVMRHKEALTSAYKSLAKISVFGAVVLLFIYYNEIVISAWWREGAKFETLKVLFTDYWPVHLIEILFIVVAIVLFLKWSGRALGLVAGSLCIGVGVLAHRFILLAPAYNVVPFKVPAAGNGGLVEWAYPIAVGEVRGSLADPQQIFVTWWDYIPSPVEFTITAGIAAGVILVYVALSKMLPLAGVTK